MIASSNDLAVATRSDYERLPEEGRWEVADGRAVLMPQPKMWHQELSDDLVAELRRQIRATGRGFVTSAVTVFIPVPHDAPGEIQSRIPDIVISNHRVPGEFEVGDPPDWVIEILSTRRGNVERSEKLDDYAKAGIREYWIVNAIDHVVEVYTLRGTEYVLSSTTDHPQSVTFPGVAVDMNPVWPVR